MCSMSGLELHLHGNSTVYKNHRGRDLSGELTRLWWVKCAPGNQKEEPPPHALGPDR